jgi:hypothetical protein
MLCCGIGRELDVRKSAALHEHPLNMYATITNTYYSRNMHAAPASLMMLLLVEEEQCHEQLS